MGVKVRLGKRIKELRTKFGYTQEQLAELMDISPKTLGWIENGRSYPTAKNIDLMANIFKIDVAEILNLYNTKNTEDMKKDIKSFVNSLPEKYVCIAHKFLNSLLH